MKRYFKKSLVALLLFCMFSPNIFGDSQANKSHAAQIGRYLSVDIKPDPAQIDLLSQTIQVRFPQDVKSIGQAMEYILRFSGYALIPEDAQSTALKSTLTKPLPIVSRQFGPMRLKDALNTLAGPAFTLSEDPLNREIDFNLKPAFANKTLRGL